MFAEHGIRIDLRLQLALPLLVCAVAAAIQMSASESVLPLVTSHPAAASQTRSVEATVPGTETPRRGPFYPPNPDQLPNPKPGTR